MTPPLPPRPARFSRARLSPHAWPHPRGGAWISTLRQAAPAPNVAGATPTAPAPRTIDLRADALAHEWLAAWYDTPGRYAGD